MPAATSTPKALHNIAQGKRSPDLSGRSATLGWGTEFIGNPEGVVQSLPQVRGWGRLPVPWMLSRYQLSGVRRTIRAAAYQSQDSRRKLLWERRLAVNLGEFPNLLFQLFKRPEYRIVLVDIEVHAPP